MSDNTATDLNGVPSDGVTTPTKVKNKVGRPANDPKTKLAQCKTLYLTLFQEGKSRADILEAFQTQYGITPGSSQVYYHEAKNAAIAAGVQVATKRSVPTGLTPTASNALDNLVADTIADINATVASVDAGESSGEQEV